MRVFAAVDLPEDLRAVLERLQRELRDRTGSSVRWVRPSGMHLTLKFLGEVEDERVRSVEDALAGVRSSPFEIELGGIGFFPAASSPRVLWVGVQEPQGLLARLQAGVEEVLAPLGFPPENRPFQPHLTLGRSRAPRGERRMIEAAERRRQESFGRFEAREFVLVRSELRPGGAVYHTLHAYPMAEAKHTGAGG